MNRIKRSAALQGLTVVELLNMAGIHGAYANIVNADGAPSHLAFLLHLIEQSWIRARILGEYSHATELRPS